MRLREFEAVARAAWDDIPADYRRGVDGLIIDRAARPHDDDPDVFTLGECVTEEFPSDFGGPDTIRSAVVLYYGSFRAVAEQDEAFDWQSEIHETILHELQHHLESLATEDRLEDVDYAVNENFKRIRGDGFDPLFYRGGERIEAMAAIEAMEAVAASESFNVDGDWFAELRTNFATALSIAVRWEGSRYRVKLPAVDADITYHYVEDGPDIGERDFCIVRVLEKGMLATLRSALKRSYTVEEMVVKAEREA